MNLTRVSRPGVGALSACTLGTALLIASLAGCSADEELPQYTCGEGTTLVDDQCVVEAAEAPICGVGAVLEDGVCVPELIDRCGAGTVREGTVCVPEGPALVCGPGTVLEDGECVVDPGICPVGQVLYEGECVELASLCGEGAVFADGQCVPVSPWRGDEIEESAENNDPAFGGEPLDIELGDGAEIALRGVAGPATDLDDDGAVDADLDGFEFAGVRGQRIEIVGSPVGAPDVGFILSEVPRERGAVSRYGRAALPGAGRDAARRFVLPFNGRYLLRVGTGRAVAAQLGIPYTSGDPSGSASFAWRVQLRDLGPDVPEAVPNANFDLTGNLGEVPRYRVDAQPGTLLRLAFETQHPYATFTTSARDGTAWSEGPALAIVPPDGLYITADQRVAARFPTQFQLTAQAAQVEDVGGLVRGDDAAASLDLAAGAGFVRFSLGQTSVVSIDVEADAESILVILRGNFEQLLRTDGGLELGAQVLLEPGVYLAGVVPVFEDAEGNAEVTLRGEDVIDFGTVVLNNPPRAVESPDISAPGSTAWFTVATTRLGELGLEAAPAPDLDAGLRVYRDRILRLGQVNFTAAASNRGEVGDREDVTLFAAPHRYLVGITNREAPEFDGPRTATLTALLLSTHPVVTDREPNDTVAMAQSFQEEVDERATFIEGRLAVGDTGTTRDVYTFTLAELSLARIALFALDPNVPIASARLELARRSDGEVLERSGPGEIEVSLEPGAYVLSVYTEGDVPEDAYAVAVAVGRSLACIPGSVRCAGENLELCDPEGAGHVPLACNTGACTTYVDGADCGTDPEGDEPNDDAANADNLGTLPQGRTGVAAQIQAEDDEDWFRFALAEGGVVTVGTRGDRDRPDERVDTYLELYDAELRLLHVDDDSGPGGYSLLSGLLLDSGTYYARIYTRGQEQGFYHFFVDYVPYLCDPTASRCEGNDLYACNGFGFAFSTACEEGCIESANRARCISLGEPNDSAEFASPVVFPGEYVGSIRPLGDADWYSLDVASPVQLTVETFFAPMEAMDTRIYVCDEARAESCGFNNDFLASNDDKREGDPYSALTVNLSSAGRYFLVVEGQFQSVGDYNLTIRETGEPNNVAADAHRLDIPSQLHARIIPRTDVDWYSVIIDRPLRMLATTAPDDGGTQMDTQMWLCREDALDGCTYGGGNVARDDNGGAGLYARIQYAVVDPGVYYIGVQGFGGSQGHYLLTLEIDPEPNERPEEATEIVVPTTLRGTLSPGTDMDWFTFEAFAQERLQFETRPVDGGQIVDTQLWLCAAQNVEACAFEGPNLIAADDGVFPQYSRFAYTFPVTARYFLGLRSAGLGEGDYELAVVEPDEPNDDADTATLLNLPTTIAARISPLTDEDWYEFRVDGPGLVLFETEALAGGQDVDTRIFVCSDDDPDRCQYDSGDLARADNIDVLNPYSRLVYDFFEPGTYYIVVESANGSTGQYRLNVSEAAEPNDTPAQASAISVPGVQIARIEPETDVDWYQFEVNFPVALTFLTRAVPDTDDVDTRIWLCDSFEPESCTFDANNLLAAADGAEDGHAQMAYDFQEPGIHFLVVESERGDTGAYELVARETGEPNGDAGTALAIALDGGAEGRINPAGEDDWYRFEVTEPIELVLETERPARGQALDTVLYVCEHSERDRCRFGFADFARNNDISEDNRYSRIVQDFAEPGTYYVVVTSNSESPGHYRLTLREEGEPNEDYLTAKSVDAPGMDRARIGEASDVDWYRIEVDAPKNLSIVTRPVEGATLVDTRIFVCDEDRADRCAYNVLDLGRDDDSGGAGYSRLNQIFRSAGTYYVAVESVGNDTGHFWLEFRQSDEPNDSAVFATFIQVPRTVQAEIVPSDDVDWYVFDASPDTLLRFDTAAVENGEAVDTRMWLCVEAGVESCSYFAGNLVADDNSGDDDGYSAMEYDFGMGGLFFVAVESVGDDVGDYALTVTEPGEPNDGPTEATPLLVPGSHVGRIGTPEDEDWFRFTVEADETLTFEARGIDGGTDFDARMFLCDDQVPEACNYGLFQNLERNDDGNGIYPRIVYQFQRAGTYFVVIDSSGETGDYELDVR